MVLQKLNQIGPKDNMKTFSKREVRNLITIGILLVLLMVVYHSCLNSNSLNTPAKKPNTDISEDSSKILYCNALKRMALLNIGDKFTKDSLFLYRVYTKHEAIFTEIKSMSKKSCVYEIKGLRLIVV